MVHWRRKSQPTPVSLLQEPHEQYEKAENMTLEDKACRLEVFHMLVGKSRGQLLTAPETMKWLDQSGIDAQL